MRKRAGHDGTHPGAAVPTEPGDEGDEEHVEQGPAVDVQWCPRSSGVVRA